MKKTLVFIGAGGNAESVIVHHLAKAGYRILLMDKNEGKAGDLHASVLYYSPGADVEVINCAYESCWEADIIISAVESQEQQGLVDKIKDVVTGKIVIRMDVPGTSSNAAEELQALLPHSKIVKVACGDFSNPSSEIILTGDDDVAVETVVHLMEDAGFNPGVAGKLSAHLNPDKI